MAIEDLIPVTERTKDEAKKISQSGGIASGEARRRRKAFKKIIDELLTRDISSKKDLALAQDFDLKDDVTQEQLIMMALLKAAKAGNVHAVREIRSITRDDEDLKIERERLRIEQEKLKLMKDKQNDDGEALDKLDEILSKI